MHAVIKSRICFFITTGVCSIFYATIAVDFGKVEFLHMVMVPFKNQAITYTTGLDGYPAFQFSAQSHVEFPAIDVIEDVGSSFAITVVVRTDNDEGGFLFAITNPTDTIVQFGLEISPNLRHSNKPKIVLYYSDIRKRSSSYVIAEFLAMLKPRKWMKFGLKVKNRTVDLFQGCKSTRHTAVELLEPLEGLTFEEESKAYLAQAGSKIGRKFVGGILLLGLHENPDMAESLCDRSEVIVQTQTTLPPHVLETPKDIDECAEGISNCEHNCRNAVGGYNCSCNSGYQLHNDLHKCYDIDECNSGAHGCGQVCVNAIGNYSCDCNSGFVLVDRFSCHEDSSSIKLGCGIGNGIQSFIIITLIATVIVLLILLKRKQAEKAKEEAVELDGYTAMEDNARSDNAEDQPESAYAAFDLPDQTLDNTYATVTAETK